MTTIKDLSSQLNSQVESVCQMLLPGGQVDGRYFVAGSVAGEEGKSLKVNLSGGYVGKWKDYASGEKGGDLVDLWAQTKRLSLNEALQEIKAYLGIAEVAPVKKPKETKPPSNLKNVKKISSGSPAEKYLTGRGLTTETIKLFKVADGVFSVEKERLPAVVFPFYEEDKKTLSMVKRLIIKRVNGKKNIAPTSGSQKKILFGWQAIPDNSRAVIICEGEINAMSISQMGYPALATPYGAGKGNKHDWLENEFDRLQRFEKIYLWFDSDAPGQDAQTDLPGRLGLDRCWIVDGSKDANDILKSSGKCADLITGATETTPAFISRMADLAEDAADWHYGKRQDVGYTLPFNLPKHRLRPGEVSVIAGYNSHGKSTVLLQLIAYLLKKHFAQNIEICLATMEGNLNSQIVRIIRYYLAQDGMNLPEKKQEFLDVTRFIGQAISLYNEPGDGKVKNVLECFRYARSRYGADLFLIDNLTSLDVGIEDYDGQRKFVQKILAFAKKENVHVIVVAHMRKPQGFSDSPPGRYSLRGSSSVADLVDNFFIVWRNEHDNIKFPPAVFKVDKDRENGILLSVSLSFNPEIGFVEE